MNNFMLYPCVYGVLAVEKTKKIATLVKSNGRIDVKVEKHKLKFSDKFFLRGFFFLIYGIFYTLYGIFNFNLKSQEELTRVKKASNSLNVSTKSVVLFVILISSTIITFFLLGFIPIKLSYWLTPKNYNMLLKRLMVALSKIVIISIVLFILKFIPGFKNYYRFNSACEEKQKEMKQINFLSYFICSIFLNTFVLAFVGLVANSWYFIFINLFISLMVFIVNYEIFSEMQRVTWLKTIISPICNFTLQKASHLEQKCVSIVLSELELYSSKRDKMQEEKTNSTMPFSEAYVLAKEILEKANKFEKSDLDFIFAEVLNKSRAEIRLIKNISKSDYKIIEGIVRRRANGEPISKIFQKTNFYGLDFIVTKDVLSPRMDTERLVEAVLKEVKPKQLILDIGTGSGAIAIAIAKNSKAKITAVDISTQALSVAKQNAKNNMVNVKFIKSDLFEALGKFAKYDIIVSNPPYIPTKDIDSLDDEVKKYDPILALDGGVTGLEFYKTIIDEAPKRLKANGKIFFEVGINQAVFVKKLLQKNFKDIRIVKDYNKIDRVVYATVK